MSLRFIFHATLLCALCLLLTACPGEQADEGGYFKINTFVVSDSNGYKVGKGVAYATVYIDDPSGLSELCKKNYAVWVSTILQVDPTDDKNAIKSLASAYTRTEALKNQAVFVNSQEELNTLLVREIFTKTGIRKVYEDKDFITFMKEDTVYKGDQNKFHLKVGYTFTKSDFTLAELLPVDSAATYRKAITEQLGKTLKKTPEQLLDYLLIEDDCRKEGLVPLPANGAFLEDDSLVFLYQEYEIAPYRAGILCVRLPFNRATAPSAMAEEHKRESSEAKRDSSDVEKKSSQTGKQASESSRKEEKKSDKSTKSKKSDKKSSKK